MDILKQIETDRTMNAASAVETTVMIGEDHLMEKHLPTQIAGHHVYLNQVIHHHQEAQMFHPHKL